MKTHRDPLADALREALDAEPPHPDDAALLARALDGATRTLATTATASAPREGVARIVPKKRALWLRVALPLAAAFGVSMALAAAYVATRTPVKKPEPVQATEPSPPVETAPPPGRQPHGSAQPNDPRVEAPPSMQPTFSVHDLPTAATPVVSAEKNRPGTAAAPTESTAAELFRDANAERRAGNVARAAELYRALQNRFPESPETHASRVSLGRLLLERQGDATGALAQFDAYLRSGDSTLAEEARVGRALAFERLGRAGDERGAWEELLAQHPNSLHAARARKRLDALH